MNLTGSLICHVFISNCRKFKKYEVRMAFKGICSYQISLKLMTDTKLKAGHTRARA
jgi:hypothetical protein